jgi:hypothetical protein
VSTSTHFAAIDRFVGRSDRVSGHDLKTLRHTDDEFVTAVKCLVSGLPGKRAVHHDSNLSDAAMSKPYAAFIMCAVALRS